MKQQSYLGPWKHSMGKPDDMPTEEGMYLTICFTSGCFRYPRLVRVWRGPKSGRLYADTLGLHERVKLEDAIFNCSWIKINSPIKEDAADGWHLGMEWVQSYEKELDKNNRKHKPT